MPRVQKISVTVGGKANLGNYENLERTVTLDGSVLPGESADNATRKLLGMANDLLAGELLRVVEDQIDIAVIVRDTEDDIRRKVRYSPLFRYVDAFVSSSAALGLANDLVNRYAKSESAPVSAENPAAGVDDEVEPSVQDDTPEFDDGASYDDPVSDDTEEELVGAETDDFSHVDE